MICSMQVAIMRGKWKGMGDPGQDLNYRRKWILHKNVAELFFMQDYQECMGYFTVHQSSVLRNSMCHVFVVQYWLYANVANLNAINKHFLRNQDCMELIGGYLGLKKEWAVSDENVYRDQAYEIARDFHCEETYFGPYSILSVFEGIKEFGVDFFTLETKLFIDATIEVAMKWTKEIKFQQKQAPLFTPASRWTTPSSALPTATAASAWTSDICLTAVFKNL